MMATPMARAAVGTVLLKSPAPLGLLARFFCRVNGKPLRQLEPGRIYFGRWQSAGGDEPGEEVVVAAPAGRPLEIHCHGGVIAASRIVHDLERAGCDVTDPQAAWDPLPAAVGYGCAEAAALLPQALTERAAFVLLDQVHGALHEAMMALSADLHRGNLDAVVPRVARLRRLIPVGRHLTRPWPVALVGRPNVGKSSLMNAIAGFRRALVYDEPGTTRDLVTLATAIDDWPFQFVDTAGIRQSGEVLEEQGVERSLVAAKNAACRLLVTDVTQPWAEDEEALRQRWPDAIVVHNKSDQIESGPHGRPEGLLVSAWTGEGVDTLLTTVRERLIPDPPQPGEAVLFSDSQMTTMAALADPLDAGCMQDAIACLPPFFQKAP